LHGKRIDETALKKFRVVRQKPPVISSASWGVLGDSD